MKTKIILWIIAMICLSSIVLAVEDDAMQYISLDNSTISGSIIIDQSDAGNNGTKKSSTEPAQYGAGFHNDAFDFDGTDDQAYSNLSLSISGFTIVAWIKPDDFINHYGLWGTTNTGNNNGFVCHTVQTTGVARCQTFVSGTTKLNFDGATKLSTTDYTHIVTRYFSNGTMDIWINGTKDGQADSDSLTSHNVDLYYGAIHQINLDYDGKMDEILVYNRSLADSEITTLYNGGAFYNPYGTIAGVTETYLSSDYENNQNTIKVLFENFNITNLSTATLHYNNTDYSGAINHQNNSWVEFHYNITTPNPIYLNNTNVSFYWNYTINYANSTNQTGTTTLHYQAVYWNLTEYPRVKINATDLTTGSAINVFSVNDSTKTFNTTNGIVWFYENAAGTYAITIDNTSYEMKTENVTFTSGSLGTYTFELYTTNSVMLNFFDEETKAPVYNVSFELISTIFGANYTTTPNATKYLDLLSPTTYTLRFSADDYQERFYYFTLTNRTFTNLTLYLLANNSATEVTAIVYDEGNDELEDAYIKVLRYDINTNSYVVTEIAKTNFEGTTMLHLVLNSEFYKFMIEYPYGTLRKTTAPTYIYETTLNFQILLGTETAENFYDFMGVDTDLTFNNATNNFRFTYNDGDNVLSQACLKVWEVGTLKETLLNTTCLSTSSGTILIGVTATNGTTYKASAYIYFDSTEYYVGSESHTFPAARLSGNLGMFFVIILMIVFAMIGFWNIIVAGILFPLPLIFGSLLNIIPLGLEILIPIEAISIVLAFVISRYA